MYEVLLNNHVMSFLGGHSQHCVLPQPHSFKFVNRKYIALQRLKGTINYMSIIVFYLSHLVLTSVRSTLGRPNPDWRRD